MSTGRPNWRDYAYFAFTIVAIGIMALAIIVGHDHPKLIGWTFWVGNVPMISIVGSSLGITIGSISLFLLARRTRFLGEQVVSTNRAERSSRFQKGVELVAAEQEASRIGGIYIIRDVAIEDPERYARNAFELLAAVIASESQEHYADVNLPRHQGPELKVITQAIETIGLIERNIETEYNNIISRKVVIKDGYFCDAMIVNAEFRRIFFSNCTFVNFTFGGCTFDECIFTRCVVGSLNLLNGTAKNVTIRETSGIDAESRIGFQGVKFVDSSIFDMNEFSRLKCYDCDISGSEIDVGYTVIDNCFYADEEPRFMRCMLSPNALVRIYKWEEGCGFAAGSTSVKEFTHSDDQEPAIVIQRPRQGAASIL